MGGVLGRVDLRSRAEASGLSRAVRLCECRRRWRWWWGEVKARDASSQFGESRHRWLLDNKTV
jgi:hypothetical protein